jgi:hypothetical protein
MKKIAQLSMKRFVIQPLMKYVKQYNLHTVEEE